MLYQRIFFVLLVFLFSIPVSSQVSQIVLNDGSIANVKMNSQICADFIFVNSGAVLIAEDSSCVCPEAVIGGGGDITLPVELVSFNARLTGNTIELAWNTASEKNNYGFEIELKKGENGSWEKIGFVRGKGNSNKNENYLFHYNGIITGSSLFFRLKQIDLDGNFYYSEEITLDIRPDNYNISQNYPNPFNPVTKIVYSIPEFSSVKIDVINAIGQVIEILENKNAEPGKYELVWNASRIASGAYFIRMEAVSKESGEKFNKLIKAVLLK